MDNMNSLTVVEIEYISGGSSCCCLNKKREVVSEKNKLFQTQEKCKKYCCDDEKQYAWAWTGAMNELGIKGKLIELTFPKFEASGYCLKTTCQ